MLGEKRQHLLKTCVRQTTDVKRKENGPHKTLAQKTQGRAVFIVARRKGSPWSCPIHPHSQVRAIEMEKFFSFAVNWPRKLSPSPLQQRRRRVTTDAQLINGTGVLMDCLLLFLPLVRRRLFGSGLRVRNQSREQVRLRLGHSHPDGRRPSGRIQPQAAQLSASHAHDGQLQVATTCRAAQLDWNHTTCVENLLPRKYN